MKESGPKNDGKVVNFQENASPRMSQRQIYEEAARQDETAAAQRVLSDKVRTERVNLATIHEVIDFYAKDAYARLNVARSVAVPEVAASANSLAKQFPLEDALWTWKNVVMRNNIDHAALVLSDAKFREQYDASLSAAESLVPLHPPNKKAAVRVEQFAIPHPANDEMSQQRERDVAVHLYRAARSADDAEFARVNHPLHMNVLVNIALGPGGGPQMLKGYLRGVVGQLVPRVQENQQHVETIAEELFQKTVHSKEFINALRNVGLGPDPKRAWLSAGIDVEKLTRSQE